MIYQFEHKEIDICNKCPMRAWSFDTEGCTLINKLISGSKTPQENNCPLVAIPKTETTSCEWCEIASACEYEVAFFRDDDRWATERSLMPKFCPNCGRRLEEAQ